MGSGWSRTNYSWYKSFLKKELIVLTSILLLCFGLRVFNFSSASLWVDEAYTMMLAHQKTHDIVKTSVNDINPPLYGIVVRKWAKHFGFTHVSLRFFSVICSILTGIILYRIGRKYFNYLTAVSAVLFYSFSNLQIYYAEEARGYALAGLLCAASTYYFLSFIRHKKTVTLVMLTLMNILILYTHYVAGFLFVAQAIIAVLFFYNKFRFLWKYLLSQLIALSAFLPWFLSSWFKLDGFQIGWLPELSFGVIEYFFIQVLNSKTILILILFWLLISFILFLVFKNNRKLKQYFVIFTLGVMPLILICLSTQYYVRLFLDRYILFSTVSMFIFFGFIFSSVRIHLLFKTLMIGIYLYLAIANVKVDAFRNEEWDRACATGAALTNDTTTVLLNPPYIKFCFDYYNLRWAYDNDYKHIEQIRTKHNIFAVGDTNSIKDLSYRLGNRIIFYSSHYWGGDNDKKTIESFLSKTYNQTYLHQFWNVRLYVYEKKQQLP